MDEVLPGQAGRFQSAFGIDITPWRGVFTFPPLAEVPEYSIQGAPFLGTVALESYAGTPAELFEANGFVYDFSLGEVVPEVAITRRAALDLSGMVYVSNGLLLPGSLRDDGTRVKNYTAWFSFDTATFRYSEVTFD